MMRQLTSVAIFVLSCSVRSAYGLSLRHYPTYHPRQPSRHHNHQNQIDAEPKTEMDGDNCLLTVDLSVYGKEMTKSMKLDITANERDRTVTVDFSNKTAEIRGLMSSESTHEISRTIRVPYQCEVLENARPTQAKGENKMLFTFPLKKSSTDDEEVEEKEKPNGVQQKVLEEKADDKKGGEKEQPNGVQQKVLEEKADDKKGDEKEQPNGVQQKVKECDEAKLRKAESG